MGGMHLGDAPENYVEKVTAALAERFRVQLWRPCHCTGIHAAWRLASKAGNVEWAGVGTTLDL
jgi:7,8-dihydropterin-6-yl-methyl-4-(beta-D-ribofuranosyl)aminobenzene 5'-phosphate synthase